MSACGESALIIIPIQPSNITESTALFYKSIFSRWRGGREPALNHTTECLIGVWSGEYNQYGGDARYRKRYAMQMQITDVDPSSGLIRGTLYWPDIGESVTVLEGTVEGSVLTWRETRLQSRSASRGAPRVDREGIYRADFDVTGVIQGKWYPREARGCKDEGSFSLHNTKSTTQVINASNSDDEVEQVKERCRQVLPLAEATLGSEYAYPHLPLCVLDAVWSIGVRYAGVQNVIARYCAHYGIWNEAKTDAPSSLPQHSVAQLIDNIRTVGVESFAVDVVCNTQRTSPRSGILKAEAVYRFAQVLNRHGVQHLEDVPANGSHKELEAQIQRIPGQSSGVSLKYFFMLCGDSNLIKPDRMTRGFLSETLGRSIDEEEAQALLTEASRRLNREFPALTPRGLDHEVWKYQRSLAPA